MHSTGLYAGMSSFNFVATFFTMADRPGISMHPDAISKLCPALYGRAMADYLLLELQMLWSNRKAK